jgi:hypothetical protein
MNTKEPYAQNLYAATLVYTETETEDLQQLIEGFVGEFIEDVVTDSILEGKLVKGDELLLFVEDALTVSNDDGSHARVFIAQSIHPIRKSPRRKKSYATKKNTRHRTNTAARV